VLRVGYAPWAGMTGRMNTATGFRWCNTKAVPGQVGTPLDTFPAGVRCPLCRHRRADGMLSGLRCDGRQLSGDRAAYCPDGSAEPLGAERGIITKVEVDVSLERAIGVERGPTAAAHLIALVRTLP
jgi:hypothetical protein